MRGLWQTQVKEQKVHWKVGATLALSQGEVHVVSVTSVCVQVSWLRSPLPLDRLT